MALHPLRSYEEIITLCQNHDRFSFELSHSWPHLFQYEHGAGDYQEKKQHPNARLHRLRFCLAVHYGFDDY